MKKLRIPLISLVFFFCFWYSKMPFFLFELSEEPRQPEYAPDELFFLQRSFSDKHFSIEAYSNALYQAKTSLQLRTHTGFNAAWMVQGPGNFGARINTVAVNPENESIMYVGFSAGGVFKTHNGGQTWAPIFDDQLFLAIGDIVLDPDDPDIVYVGTGDVNISGYPFIGDGLYRSKDGGNTWEHLGLSQQRIISKIVIDPTNSDILYVGCMGLPFERNPDRGLYKSMDGGKNWEKVLFLGNATGVIDVLINPQDPQILYAAGWDRIRNNEETITWGGGARVYRSSNGGNSWTMLKNGLPNAQHSRIGLAMSGTNPDFILAEYAGTDEELEGIFKTTDGGATWKPIPIHQSISGLSSAVLGGLGWYFGKIRINPNNDNDIALLGIHLWRTLDGGQNWVAVTSSSPTSEDEVHVDHHDLVFLPSGKVVLATDGGLYRSDLSMTEWEDLENIPATQFYRVAYNPHAPENYYGGTQDNGSVAGNATGLNSWQRILGGDGFTMIFDPIDPDRYFVELQNGRITVTLDGGKQYALGTEGVNSNDRFNWDTPYILSPHDPFDLYLGTQRVYKGVGAKPQWEPISEDLTSETTGLRNYPNISTIDESKLQAGLLYAGTTDGNLWRKEEGDPVWASIRLGLPDQYVTDVKASSHSLDRVFVAHSGYRNNEFIPHIHRSDDRGSFWTDISGNLPELAVNDLLILPDHADSVLFVATDGGVYGTLNGGEHWDRLGNNMPLIAVYDLVHNKAKNELVAGTFARSVMTYPIDSLINQGGSLVGQSEATLLETIKIRLYPNPAREFVNISFQNTNPGQKIDLVILDLKGQSVYRSTEAGPVINRQISLSDWSAGTYILKAKIQHRIIGQSFIKFN